MLYCWAAENPQAVACIAGIYPVCNIASYPGIDRACGAYGLTAQQLKEDSCCQGVTLAQCHTILEIEDLGRATSVELSKRLGLDKIAGAGETADHQQGK